MVQSDAELAASHALLGSRVSAARSLLVAREAEVRELLALSAAAACKAPRKGKGKSKGKGASGGGSDATEEERREAVAVIEVEWKAFKRRRKEAKRAARRAKKGGGLAGAKPGEISWTVGGEYFMDGKYEVVLRYKGSVQFARGTWLGVELMRDSDDPQICDAGDGSFADYPRVATDGAPYFECPPARGVLVKISSGRVALRPSGKASVGMWALQAVALANVGGGAGADDGDSSEDSGED